LLSRCSLALFVSLSLYAQAPLQKAVALARAGRYAEAQAALKGVAEPEPLPQRIAFHRLRAAIASGLHEPDVAVAEMKAALALAPADPQLLLGVAAAELEAGKLDDALAHVEAAPSSARRDALLGDIQEKRGRALEALHAYQSAAALAPGEERYIIALALEYIEHQSYQQAIDVLRDATSRFPKSARIPTLTGIAQYGQGYTNEAAASLEDAIDLAPKSQAPYAALARIVLESSAAPPPRTLATLCQWNKLVCSALQLRIARANGDLRAERKATLELEQAPVNSAVGRCELGRAYEWTGQLAKARPQMEACVRLDPTPENHYRLALLYKRLGLDLLAKEQMRQRQDLLQKMSEETAMGLKALKELDQRR
jgi:tetratricopeptide (TPR) repeat protein